MDKLTRSLVFYAMKRASMKGFDPYNSHARMEFEFRVAYNWLSPR